MEKKVKANKKKRSLCGKGVIGLYVCAALSLICGGYMIYYSITYVQSYYSSYGMSISEGIKDVIQYVISNSSIYFGFAILFFVAGVILKKVDLLGKQPAEEAAPMLDMLEQKEEEIQDEPEAELLEKAEETEETEASDEKILEGATS